MKSWFLACLFLSLICRQGWAQHTAQEYIDTYKDWAVEAMHEYGVPASVTLAIAMHESANGNSKVATYLHNHFGIRGANNSKEIRSSYKGYDSVKASYADFIHYLKTHKQFASLFNKYPAYDYHSWAYGLMRGGYASNKTWAAHIIAQIKKYELFALDERPEGYIDPLPPATSTTEPDPNPLRAANIHIVKKGETLGLIAKRHKTTVRAIKAKNALQSDKLKIGQHLKI